MNKPIVFRQTSRRVLCAFDREKSAQLADLSQQVHKSKPAVCRALKRLSSAGMVQRVRLDARHLVFTITDDGWRLRCTWLNQKCGPRKSRPVITPREAFNGFRPN